MKLADDVEQGLKNGAGKSVGKLIAVEGNLGLGVVRLKEGLDNPTITLGKVEVTVKKPSWWPKEGDNKQTEEVWSDLISKSQETEQNIVASVFLVNQFNIRFNTGSI